MKTFLLIFLLLLTSCSLLEKSSEVQPIAPKHCSINQDCLSNEICQQNYCVSSEIEETNAKFTLAFTPQNSLNKLKYYHNLETDILTDIKHNQSFESDVSNYIELSGELLNNSDPNITYELFLKNNDHNLNFYAHSYKEGSRTLYYFKIPKGSYTLKVQSSQLYPPFTFTIGQLSESRIDHSIFVDRELSNNQYNNIQGELFYSMNEERIYPTQYNLYAFIKENNTEKIISNKFSCKENCHSFHLTSIQTTEPVFLRIYVQNLEYITFTIPLNHLHQGKSGYHIDLGSFQFSTENQLTLKSGDCFPENTELQLSSHLNPFAVYERSFFVSCLESSCKTSINTYKGDYNLFIKPAITSCYSPKLTHFRLNEDPRNLSIELNKKRSISGLIASQNKGIEAVIIFTKKDNPLDQPKYIAESNTFGDFTIQVDPGLYDIFIIPKYASISHSNWLYLNQRITYNTKELVFWVPQSYKVPMYLYAKGNKPLANTQVTLKLKNLEELFHKNNTSLPEDYPLYETLTDSKGKFILSVPIIK